MLLDVTDISQSESMLNRFNSCASAIVVVVVDPWFIGAGGWGGRTRPFRRKYTPGGTDDDDDGLSPPCDVDIEAPPPPALHVADVVATPAACGCAPQSLDIIAELSAVVHVPTDEAESRRWSVR